MPETRSIKFLIIHTCESNDLAVCDFNNITRFHTTKLNHGVWYNKKWRRGLGYERIGYHFFISRKGISIPGRRVEISAPFGRSDSIDIILAGQSCFDTRCLNELHSLIKNLCTIYSLNPTECLCTDNEQIKNILERFFN